MLLNNTSKKLLSFFIIIILLSLFTVYKETTSVNGYLATGSFILLICIIFFNFYLNDNDYFSPLTIFSVTYSGYAIGGYYYSGTQGYFGKFLGFMNLSDEKVVSLMQWGLFYALICFIFLGIGYSLFKKKVTFSDRYSKVPFWRFFGKNYLFFVVPLLIIGVLYWYWVSLVTADGMINMILFFQAFRHLVADAGVTTLPYHFYYAGIYIWMLGLITAKKKIGYAFILLSLLGMVINLSQGRISMAVTFVIAQLFFIALTDEKNRKKIFIYFLMLMGFAFLVYFLRILSNGVFIGKDLGVFEKSFFKVIIAGGNVADLQQLVIIFHAFDLNKLLLGVTYADWLRNTVGQFLGFSVSSVGLTVKDMYVPETSGAPTPGAIGEAYANFGVVAPLLMFFIGFVFACLYRFVMGKGSHFLLLIYSIFLARFIFMYPKVDSTMLVNFLWGITPFSIVIIFIYIVFLILAPLKKTI